MRKGGASERWRPESTSTSRWWKGRRPRAIPPSTSSAPTPGSATPSAEASSAFQPAAVAQQEEELEEERGGKRRTGAASVSKCARSSVPFASSAAATSSSYSSRGDGPPTPRTGRHQRRGRISCATSWVRLGSERGRSDARGRQSARRRRGRKSREERGRDGRGALAVRTCSSCAGTKRRPFLDRQPHHPLTRV